MTGAYLLSAPGIFALRLGLANVYLPRLNRLNDGPEPCIGGYPSWYLAWHSQWGGDFNAVLYGIGAPSRDAADEYHNRHSGPSAHLILPISCVDAKPRHRHALQ